MASHNNPQNETELNANVETEKGTASDGIDGRESPESLPDKNAQDGVKIAEAMTRSWSTSLLIVVYVWYAFEPPEQR